MKLTVIAATGATGRLIVDHAQQAGHDITAVVRNRAKLTADVHSATVDLSGPDLSALTAAVAGADAVVSALGATSKAEAGVATRGTRALVDAMRAGGSARLIVLSAAPLGTVPSPDRPNPPKHDPGDGYFMRRLAALPKRMFRDHYADLATMEDIVMASGLDWTIVRPPGLNNKPPTGDYRIAYGRNVRGGWFISRSDLAQCMLDLAERREGLGQTVGVAN